MSTKNQTPGQALLGRLRHHVTGAIERGEGVAIVGVPAKAAHTPGPWIAQIGDKGGTIWGPGNNPADRPIAYIRKRDDQALLDETDLANGLLLASAPELLAALRAFEAGLLDGSITFTRKRQSDGDPHHPANVLPFAAIAKATGGTP